MVAAMSKNISLLDPSRILQAHLDPGSPVVLYTVLRQPLPAHEYRLYRVVCLVSR